MPVIIVGDEKNLTALRSRLFEGPVSPAARREVTDAIRDANPHVDLEALERGTILTVPDLPKVRVRGDVSFDDVSKGAVASVADQSRAGLEALVAAGREANRDAGVQRRRAAKLLDSTEVTAAARKDDALAADVAAVRDALAAEYELAKESGAALTKARGEWTAELGALKGLVG